MAAPFQIKHNAMERFGETDDVAVPRLMHELHVPHRVAAALDVAPNAIRRWLILHDWKHDDDKGWIEPKAVVNE